MKLNSIKVNNSDASYTHSIFDISEYHDGSKYPDLATALAAVPEDKQQGGMTVRYVQTSDNNYVQFRCMAQNFTTDISQWQGIDEEPTAQSKNIVESGGVFNRFNSAVFGQLIGEEEAVVSGNNTVFYDKNVKCPNEVKIVIEDTTVTLNNRFLTYVCVLEDDSQKYGTITNTTGSSRDLSYNLNIKRIILRTTTDNVATQGNVKIGIYWGDKKEIVSNTERISALEPKVSNLETNAVSLNADIEDLSTRAFGDTIEIAFAQTGNYTIPNDFVVGKQYVFTNNGNYGITLNMGSSAKALSPNEEATITIAANNKSVYCAGPTVLQYYKKTNLETDLVQVTETVKNGVFGEIKGTETSYISGNNTIFFDKYIKTPSAIDIVIDSTTVVIANSLITYVCVLKDGTQKNGTIVNVAGTVKSLSYSSEIDRLILRTATSNITTSGNVAISIYWGDKSESKSNTRRITQTETNIGDNSLSCAENKAAVEDITTRTFGDAFTHNFPSTGSYTLKNSFIVGEEYLFNNIGNYSLSVWVSGSVQALDPGQSKSLVAAQTNTNVQCSGPTSLEIKKVHSLSNDVYEAMQPFTLDIENWDTGYYANYNPGTRVLNVFTGSGSDDYRVSGCIPIEPFRNIKITSLYTAGKIYCYFLDEAEYVIEIKEATTKITTDYECKVPDNASYVAFSIKYSNANNVSLAYTDNGITKYDYADIITKTLNEKVNRRLTGLFKSASIPMITFIDDDTMSIAHVTTFHDVMVDNGITGTFATITEKLSQSQNVGLTELLKSYEEEGFHVAYHCKSQQKYYEDDFDAALAQQDFVQGLRAIKEAGFIDPMFWVTPYGVSAKWFKDLAQRWGMNCLVSIGQKDCNRNDGTQGRFGVNRFSLQPTDVPACTLQDIYDAIDQAAEIGGWVVVGTHVYVEGWNNDYTRINNIVSYARTKGLEFCTLNEAIRKRMPIYNMYETL